MVVGGGDTAMEEATFLTRFGQSVTIVHRRGELRASKIMQERAFANPKIDFAWNSEVSAILGEDKVTGAAAARHADRRGARTRADGLFIAIGHDPRSELFKGQLELDDEGYVKVDAPSTRTNLEGVFACGDVVDHTYRQADHRGRHRLRRRPGRRALPGRAGARGIKRTSSGLTFHPQTPRLRRRRPQMSALKKVTDATFDEEVLKSDKPVLVDFWAEWCGPCRMIAPILEQISAEHGEKLEIVKLNTDENPEIATQYGVLNIPMLNVYVNGEVAKTIVGAKPKRALLKDLEDFIG